MVNSASGAVASLLQWFAEHLTGQGIESGPATPLFAIATNTLNYREEEDSFEVYFSTLEVQLSYDPFVNERSCRRNPTFLLSPKLDSDFISSYL
jgi:hypothetical protein